MSDERYLLTVPISVRWGDMDAFNHVNNATFATYVEEARLRWFATFERGWKDDDVGPVVAAQSINYRMPIEWPADLVVEQLLERGGTTSVSIAFRILSRETPPRVFADGSTVLVWADRRTGRSTPLPEPVRKAIGVE